VTGHHGPDPAGSRYRALRLARRLRQAWHRLAQTDGTGDAAVYGAADGAVGSVTGGLRVADVLALHGSASVGGLLLFWGLFSQLPVGGVGNVAAVALWWLSWGWWQGQLLPRLPQRLLQVGLNPAWSLRLLRWLAVTYRRAGLWLRPRWQGLQHGPDARPHAAWAVWIALQAAVIFLPLPLGNVLPGLSLMALGLGRLVDDGLMYLVSLGLGVLGLVYTVWLGDWLWVWSQDAWGWLVALV